MQDLPEVILRRHLTGIAARNRADELAVYRHYQTFVFEYILSKSFSPSTAEEALNDTFQAVFDRPLAFNFESKFSTWLCGIAKHKAVDVWRKSKGRDLHDSIDDESALQIEDLSVDLLGHLEEEELRKHLRKCLDELPPLHRHVMILVHAQGMNQDRAAEIMECPLGTIKSRLHHAKLKMAACMNKQDPNRSSP